MLFHCRNDCKKATYCYVIGTLLVLFNMSNKTRIVFICKKYSNFLQVLVYSWTVWDFVLCGWNSRRRAVIASRKNCHCDQVLWQRVISTIRVNPQLLSCTYYVKNYFNCNIFFSIWIKINIYWLVSFVIYIFDHKYLRISATNVKDGIYGPADYSN